MRPAFFELPGNLPGLKQSAVLTTHGLVAVLSAIMFYRSERRYLIPDVWGSSLMPTGTLSGLKHLAVSATHGLVAIVSLDGVEIRSLHDEAYKHTIWRSMKSNAVFVGEHHLAIAYCHPPLLRTPAPATPEKGALKMLFIACCRVLYAFSCVRTTMNWRLRTATRGCCARPCPLHLRKVRGMLKLRHWLAAVVLCFDFVL